ncbi:MAG: serine/threonine-protein kinase, partial [Oscillatoria sp. PMC 1076.18]|nr:serine/threonine-protein kinase [Oscillatoria sp. PMC 1076.18]
DPNEANIKPKNYENIDNSQTKKCPNCSKEVPNNANFCIFCGYKLGEYSTCIQDSLEIDISGNSSLTTTLEESPQSEIILAEHYQIIRTLGSGSFGNTFLARDIRLPSNRFCVVKVLKSCISNSQIHDFIQARFEREAVILEKLGDEIVQIPKLYAYFAEKGEFYLVQEYIQGDTLSQKVTETGTFDSEKVKAILVELLSVLVEVHRYQIIHRDIKPDNIILRSSNNQPVLIDFGAMKEVVGSMPENNSDSPGTVIIGTPGFMPGEQASGRPVYASDLYALALTAIYLLTGKLPHEIEQNEYTGELLWHQFAENFAPELVEVLDKAIQPHLEFRYQTAAEMLEALQTRKKLVTYPSEFPAIAPTSTVKNYSDQKKSGLIKRIFLYLAYFVFGIVLFAMLSGILLLVLSN